MLPLAGTTHFQSERKRADEAAAQKTTVSPTIMHGQEASFQMEKKKCFLEFCKPSSVYSMYLKKKREKNHGWGYFGLPYNLRPVHFDMKSILLLKTGSTRFFLINKSPPVKAESI